MRQLKLALLASLALAPPAYAADLAPAPVEPIAPSVYSWTGFYAGVDVGYAWANYTVPSVSLPGQYQNYATVFRTNNVDMNGMAGMVRAGVNYQFAGNWVVGAEAEYMHNIGSLGPKGSYNTIANFGKVDVNVDWYAALKGRVGYAFDRFLPYGTVGVAVVGTNVDVHVGAPAKNLRFDGGETHVGLLVGAGLEYALTDNWILRGEYDYVTVGAREYAIKYKGGWPTNVGNPVAKGDGDGHILRIGASYKF